MATWDDVRRLALALPETTEITDKIGAVWVVKDKRFVWERPLRKSDIDALGTDAPAGDILCASVADNDTKLALVASEPGIFFTTPHFEGYPAVLIRLADIDPGFLAEVVTDAWISRAPKRLAAAYVANQ